jgi:hypothetical protein
MALEEKRAMATNRKANLALWILQSLLALFFALGSGAPKLLLPTEALPMPIPLAGWFIVFVGLCEVAGGLGLILPGLTRVRPGLTTVAAACLSLLAVCATVYQLMADAPGNAVFAIVIALLAALVAYGRWRVAPLGGTGAESSPLVAAS